MLPHHEGKCANLHGHSYRLDVTVAGPLREEGPARGMVMDFSDVSTIVKDRVVTVLDHSHLNDRIENPTCERIVAWMWTLLEGSLLGLEEITLWETATSNAMLRLGDAETRSASSSAQEASK